MEEKSVPEVISPEGEFLKNLRHATADLHQKLETLPVSTSLLRDEVSLEDYAFYLACMQDVVSFYDNVILEQISDIIPRTDERKKLAAITADLEYLTNTGVNHNPVKPLVSSPPVSKGAALGMAYVIEGSTLGGRMILKHIKHHLALNEANGTSFFGGYHTETGAMWKEFLNGLTAYAVSHRGENVIEGAVEGFRMIYEHFSKNEPAR